jgi:hypothetical protein
MKFWLLLRFTVVEKLKTWGHAIKKHRANRFNCKRPESFDKNFVRNQLLSKFAFSDVQNHIKN